MKRVLVGFLAALPLIVGVSAAQADGFGFGGGDQSGGTQAQDVTVAGTVVSVSGGSILANAFVVPQDNQGDENQSEDNDADDQNGLGSPGSESGGGGSHHGDSMDTPGTTPATTQVTITPDSTTQIEVNGQSGTVANISPGDKFEAVFSGSPTDPITTIVSKPPLELKVHTPDTHSHGALYAFVGSVTAVDTTAGTVTVNVSRSLPSSLVPAGSSPVTFTIGPNTLILGGSSGLIGGSLTGVSPGDIVAGGLFAPAGQTLTQIGTLPLRVLLDLPASSTSTSTPAQTAKAKAKALRRAVALLDGKAKGKAKSKHKAKKHHAHKR
jgi:hypothetical protein